MTAPARPHAGAPHAGAPHAGAPHAGAPHAAPGAGALVAAAVEAVVPGAAAAGKGRPAWTPRVILRRPLAREDRVAAGVAGAAAAVATGLVTYYLATIWRARDPR